MKKRVNNDKELFAFLSILLSVIGFIIALIVKRDDKYVMFYAKQSLILFIAMIITSGVKIIPLIGRFISTALWIIVIVLWIISLVYSLSGEMKETPLIGDYANKINL